MIKKIIKFINRLIKSVDKFFRREKKQEQPEEPKKTEEPKEEKEGKSVFPY